MNNSPYLDRKLRSEEEVLDDFRLRNNQYDVCGLAAYWSGRRKMNIRIRHEKLGGHIHMRVFVGKGKEFTHACAGSLCVRDDEFEDFQRQWRSDVEWVERGDEG